jgi:hypothetical protein
MTKRENEQDRKQVPPGGMRWRALGVVDALEERVLPHLPARAADMWLELLVRLIHWRRARCPHGMWSRYSPGGLEACDRCGMIRTTEGVLIDA